MKKKKGWRKVFSNTLWIIYWVSIGMLVTTLTSGKFNMLTKIALILNLIYIVICVVYRILGRIQIKSILKCYREVFQCLKTAQGMRYRSYLNSKMEEVEEYSRLVKMCVDALLDTGEKLINNSKTIPKERKEIKDIMDKAKVMEKSIVPF